MSNKQIIGWSGIDEVEKYENTIQCKVLPRLRTTIRRKRLSRKERRKHCVSHTYQ